MGRHQPVVLLSDGFRDDAKASLCGNRIPMPRRCRQERQADMSEVTPVSRETGVTPGDEIFSFCGIPFAEITERFAPPRSLRKLWNGHRQAKSFGKQEHAFQNLIFNFSHKTCNCNCYSNVIMIVNYFSISPMSLFPCNKEQIGLCHIRKLRLSYLSYFCTVRIARNCSYIQHPDL